MLFFETLEHRSPDPAAAVVGSQLPIGDDEHTSLGFLHHHLAGRDENPEIDNRRLRPVLKPLSDGPAVLLVDKVELALLCRAACPDQFVVNPVPNEPGEGVLDLRFFVIVERLIRHVHTRYLDSGIEHAQQRVLEWIKIVQTRCDPSVAVDLKILELIGRDSVVLRLGIFRHFYSPYLFVPGGRKELRSLRDRKLSRSCLAPISGSAGPRPSSEKASVSTF